MSELRRTFALDAVAVLEADGDGWRLIAAAGGAGAGPARGRAALRRACARARCWCCRARCSSADDRRLLERVRRAAPACAGARAARSPGRVGHRARGGQQPTHRAARGRLARPANAARGDQGRGHEPALARGRLASGADPGLREDDRRRDRPADPPRLQPARHEPVADRRAEGRGATDRRSKTCSTRRSARSGAVRRASSSTCPIASPRRRHRRRAARAGDRQHRRQRARRGRRRRDVVRVEAARRSATTSTCE